MKEAEIFPAKYKATLARLEPPYSPYASSIGCMVYAATLLTYFENKHLYDHVVLYERLSKPQTQRYTCERTHSSARLVTKESIALAWPIGQSSYYSAFYDPQFIIT